MIEILYQDRDVVVCVKPIGISSQDAGETSLPAQLKAQLDLPYLAVVHRLDQSVGGVMVYAISKKAAAALSKAIQENKLTKEYRAILNGVPGEAAGTLEDLLFHDRTKNKTYVVQRERKGVKDAKLDYQVLKSSSEKCLVQIRLHTGRTHQIRVQFASRKLPLVGDRKYGSKEGGNQLALWAWRLSFPHPITGKRMTFTMDPPETAPWTSL